MVSANGCHHTLGARTDMTDRSRNLTLEEIGERAGVSRSTVSRVLNAHPQVRPEVRARVEAVIAETGYSPNPAARALVSKRSGLIGLIIPTEVDELFGDPYYSALIHGIQLGCLDHQLIFSIFPVLGSGGRADALTGQIAQGFVDGVIVTAGIRSEQIISQLRDRRTDLVVIGHPADDRGLARIDVENCAGAEQAVDHLIEHGRRRIAYIGPPDDYVFAAQRRAGYANALRRAGLTVDDTLIAFEQPTADGGRRAASAMMAFEPDAMFVGTDTMAEGVFDVLTRAGTSIPNEVAIVGFDGLPRGAVTQPVLTTVVQPVVEVGRRAVAALATRDLPVAPLVMPTELRIGRSCGCDESSGAGQRRLADG